MSGCLSAAAPWMFLQIREREREAGSGGEGGEQSKVLSKKKYYCPRSISSLFNFSKTRKSEFK